MHTRRFMAVLGVTLALAALNACGGPAARPTPARPALAAELVFYDWSGDMPQAVLDAFAAEYGVSVNYAVYESQEEAIENIRAGMTYDVVVMEGRFIPLLAQEGLLAEIDYRNVPNFRNISANFRDLAYDPDNRHAIPYNWGSTGLVVRSDLVTEPVTSWQALWDLRYAGKVALWAGQPRETLALTLKSLGYSANSEIPAELDAALARLLELKPRLLFIEDYDPVTSANMLAEGKAVIAVGFAFDVLEGRQKHSAITYVLPAEGALLWGDTFIIPANSPNRYTAEVFLNFILRPEVNAQIANGNYYATPNEAAYPFIDPALLNNPVIFPPAEDVKRGEIILPLSPAGQALYDDIWKRFMAAGQ